VLKQEGKESVLYIYSPLECITTTINLLVERHIPALFTILLKAFRNVKSTGVVVGRRATTR
jgi:hypothetical protein